MPSLGKSKKSKDSNDAAVTSDQLNDDIKALEDYERQSKLADAQRQHLKVRSPSRSAGPRQSRPHVFPVVCVCMRAQRMQATELTNTKLNHLKVLNQWRTFMRNNKLENLKRDIEVLAQDHEREVDRKDAIINLLLRNLEESDEQLQVAQRSHLSQTDRLVSLHESRLTVLENEFEAELHTIRQEFDSELKQLNTTFLREKRELSNIISTVEADLREQDLEAKQEHMTEREDIKNKNDDDNGMLKLTLENVIGDLEKQFDEAHAQVRPDPHRSEAPPFLFLFLFFCCVCASMPTLMEWFLLFLCVLVYSTWRTQRRRPRSSRASRSATRSTARRSTVSYGNSTGCRRS